MFEFLKNWFGTDNAAQAQAKPVVSLNVSFPTGDSEKPPETNEHRPVIGISGANVPGSSKSVAAMFAQIRAAGAQPRLIGMHGKRIEDAGSVDNAVSKDLAKLDGLVIMGNDGDIDPAKYGAAKGAYTNIETDIGRAAYEEAAIRKALDSGMPLLGVCGGMQRINILGGGTLHQHVPDLVGDNHHMQGDTPGFVPVQAVQIAPGSKLAGIAGFTQSVYVPGPQELPPGVVMENSFHHQSVKDVRPDFTISALSSDGIVQAIEPKAGSQYADQYVTAVQWHPEFGASDMGTKIVSSITEAAKSYAAKKTPDQQAQAQDAATPADGRSMVEMILKQRQNAVMMR